MRCCYRAELLQLILLRTNYAAWKKAYVTALQLFSGMSYLIIMQWFPRYSDLSSCNADQVQGLSKHTHSNSHALGLARSCYESTDTSGVTNRGKLCAVQFEWAYSSSFSIMACFTEIFGRSHEVSYTNVNKNILFVICSFYYSFIGSPIRDLRFI